MSERAFFEGLLVAWFATAAVTFVALLFVSAPYGRHGRPGWGPRVPFARGWILMEAPAPLLFALWYALGDRHGDPAALAFLALWQVHYLHRAFVYPVLRRERASPMPLAVAAMGLLFNAGNAYLNGRWLFALGPAHGAAWLADPRFFAGAAIFLAGLAINLHADAVLRGLRRPGERDYGIPRGGLYRLISCPNYLGEILEWTGWALATWSLPGLAFAVFTVANLAPRARAHHRWYQERFPDYPRERRALVPYVF